MRGDTVMTTVTLTNNSPPSDETLHDVSLRLVVPPYADSGSIRPGQEVVVDVGDLAVGAVHETQIPVRIRTGSAGPPPGTVLNLNARVTTQSGHRTDLRRVVRISAPPPS